MDIETAVEVMRQWAREIHKRESQGNTGPVEFEDVADIIEQWEAIDQWLTKGGFMPQAWRRSA